MKYLIILVICMSLAGSVHYTMEATEADWSGGGSGGGNGGSGNGGSGNGGTGK